MWRQFLHIIWPAACPICGRLGERLCAACGSLLLGQSAFDSAFCMLCGGDEPCGMHPDGPFCRAATDYDDRNREIVHSMKYANGRGLAVTMGRLLAERFARPDIDCLVPVPLHRRSERDFNQAERIACGISQVWNVPVDDFLVWSRVVPRQTQKRRNFERNLADNEMTARNNAPAGAAVYLIDDVYTTGNTLRAAMKAVESTGSHVAGALVWSRSRRKEKEVS